MRSTSTRSMIIDRKQRTLKWFMSLRYVVSNAAEANWTEVSQCLYWSLLLQTEPHEYANHTAMRQTDRQTDSHAPHRQRDRGTRCYVCRVVLNVRRCKV